MLACLGTLRRSACAKGEKGGAGRCCRAVLGTERRHAGRYGAARSQRLRPRGWSLGLRSLDHNKSASTFQCGFSGWHAASLCSPSPGGDGSRDAGCRPRAAACVWREAHAVGRSRGVGFHGARAKNRDGGACSRSVRGREPSEEQMSGDTHVWSLLPPLPPCRCAVDLLVVGAECRDAAASWPIAVSWLVSLHVSTYVQAHMHLHACSSTHSGIAVTGRSHGRSSISR